MGKQVVQSSTTTAEYQVTEPFLFEGKRYTKDKTIVLSNLQLESFAGNMELIKLLNSINEEPNGEVLLPATDDIGEGDNGSELHK